MQELQKLCSKSFDQWPTYSSVLKSITQEDGNHLYQQTALARFDAAQQHYSSHCEQYCTAVTTCLRSRLEWTDVEFVRDVIVFLATQGWQKLADEEGEGYVQAIDRLISKFKVPLEASGVVVAKVAVVICLCMQHNSFFYQVQATRQYGGICFILQMPQIG